MNPTIKELPAQRKRRGVNDEIYYRWTELRVIGRSREGLK